MKPWIPNRGSQGRSLEYALRLRHNYGASLQCSIPTRTLRTGASALARWRRSKKTPNWLFRRRWPDAGDTGDSCGGSCRCRSLTEHGIRSRVVPSGGPRRSSAAVVEIFWRRRRNAHRSDAERTGERCQSDSERVFWMGNGKAPQTGETLLDTWVRRDAVRQQFFA
jgi:hypothetical protein